LIDKVNKITAPYRQDLPQPQDINIAEEEHKEEPFDQ
jgi:hypothetical protein